MPIICAVRAISASLSSGVALRDFLAGLLDHRVEQVVGFDAETLPAGDLDERPLGVLRIGRRRKPQLARRGMRQRHHLVREVVRPLRAFRMAHGDERLLQQLLEIRLPDVDHVVDVRGAAIRRMVGCAIGARRGP